jgi:hypothetical protein
MNCNFCGDPAAHPATGCEYGPRTLACHACVLDFWAWVVRHTAGKSRRAQKKLGRHPGMLSFYECASKWRRADLLPTGLDRIDLVNSRSEQRG